MAIRFETNPRRMGKAAAVEAAIDAAFDKAHAQGETLTVARVGLVDFEPVTPSQDKAAVALLKRRLAYLAGNTAAATKPWLALGISRRRKRERKL